MGALDLGGAFAPVVTPSGFAASLGQWNVDCSAYWGGPGFALHGLPEINKMLSWFELLLFLAVWVAIQVWLLPRLGVPT